MKILLLEFIRWNKIRSYTEKVKYPLFLHATSGRLPLIAAFCLRWFLVFKLFKWYLASFSMCNPIFYPLNTSNKTKLTRVARNKMLVFRLECWRVGESIMTIVFLQSIKNTENLIFESVRSNWPFQGGTSVVVPYCYSFILSVFKFYVAEWPPIWERAVHSIYCECLL